MIEHLRLRQHKLEHLQCPSSPDLYRLYSGLTALDVFYDEELSHLVQDLQHLLVFGKRIRRLSLTVNLDAQTKDSDFDLQTKFEPTTYMPSLKELRLEGMYLGDHDKSLSKLVDFTTLSHFSIMECEGLGLVTPASYKRIRTTELKLEHLATGSYMNVVPDSVSTQLSFSAPNIKSLHCSLGCYLRPEDMLSLGLQLKMLSLEDDLQLPSQPALYEKRIVSICNACPNLEQLGWMLPNQIHSDSHDETREFGIFMVCM
jgi:hypothetical protein